jgi:predicted HicB family RNase H-like nuclease
MAEKRKATKTAEKQVRISEALHKRLSVFTAKGGTSNATTAEAAIDEYLKRRGA